MDAYKEIIDLIESKQNIPKQKVLSWMKEGDIKAKGALYVLTDVAWSRF